MEKHLTSSQPTAKNAEINGKDLKAEWEKLFGTSTSKDLKAEWEKLFGTSTSKDLKAEWEKLFGTSTAKNAEINGKDPEIIKGD